MNVQYYAWDPVPAPEPGSGNIPVYYINKLHLHIHTYCMYGCMSQFLPLILYLMHFVVNILYWYWHPMKLVVSISSAFK